ncbi:MAG: hypothetical protein ACXWL2_00665 [Candidatus Chromulinivorax sp.]
MLSIFVLFSYVTKTLTSSKENHFSNFKTVSNFNFATPEERLLCQSPKLRPEQVGFAVASNLEKNHENFPRISEIKEKLMQQRNHIKN